MNARLLPGHALSILGGAALAALLVLGTAEALSTVEEGPEPAPPQEEQQLSKTPPTPPQKPVRPSERLLLAWSTGGLPLHTETTLERMRMVQDATTVAAGVDWLQTTVLSDGSRIRAPKGLAYPLEVARVEPAEYARFVPAGERRAILGLGPGRAVLAESSAEIRGADVGSTLVLEDRQVTVTGIVSDVAANGYEVLFGGGIPSTWQRVDRFVLLHLERASARDAVERKLDELVPPNRAFRVRARGETPYLRYGDAVLPQMLIKKTFGEFAAQPLPDGRILVDEAWHRSNIVEIRVPLLGEVTCHRVLIPQLRTALREVEAAGLGFTVHPAQYGGCYGARFIDRDPKGRISHHAWGVAVDINVAENAFGTRPDQDPRLIEVFEDHGFTWGGRWLVPDGMHFEWARFP